MTASEQTRHVSAMPTIPAAAHLTEEKLQEFGARITALGQRVMDSRGPADEAYLRRVVAWQKFLAVLGRVTIFAGILWWPLFAIGAVILGISKIIENMEIGHNVLHGQWDWLKDPKINSSKYEWDGACPAKQWQRSHNFIHHKWTNVIGMDRDFGYHVLRLSERQEWKPGNLLQPVWNLMMALLFEYGVAVHDDQMGAWRTGEKTFDEVKPKFKALGTKVFRVVMKDYVIFPALALLAGPYFVQVLLSNLAANLIRNVWAYAVIFCGHFPDGVEEFAPEDIENEDKARWYVRQILGSANINGGKWMHFMSGNLSHQIEHHLFPRIPSNRYAEVAKEVRALCQEYGIRYNSHNLVWQLFTVWRKVFVYALPPRQPRTPASVGAG